MGVGLTASRQSEQATERTEIGPASQEEQALQGGQLDLIEQLKALAGSEGGIAGIEGVLGRLGGEVEALAGRLSRESKELPNAKKISGFLTGDDPSLRAKSRELSAPIISSARAEIDDFINSFAGQQAVAGAATGVSGSPTTGRLLGGFDVGARRLSDVISQTGAQFNPLAIGQSIGSSLSDQKQKNIAALGPLFNIGASIFGQKAGLTGARASILGGASDIGARELGRLSDLRLGTATRHSEGTRTDVGGGVNFGGK